VDQAGCFAKASADVGGGFTNPCRLRAWHDDAVVSIQLRLTESIMKIQPGYATAAQTEPRITPMVAGEFEGRHVAQEASCCSKFLGCITSILCCPCLCCLGCLAGGALAYAAAKDPEAFDTANQNLFQSSSNGAPVRLD
jgi:hypothetical protein